MTETAQARQAAVGVVLETERLALRYATLAGAPLGLCGLIRREGLDDVDIGYAYPPQHWGQGYAFEAAQGVMRYGREVLKLPRIVAIVSPGNARSIHLLEKLGLRYARKITLPGDREAINLMT